MAQSRQRLFATGHRGFVGQAMNRLISADDARVQWTPPADSFDLLDVRSIRDSLEAARPDWIVHLAAQSHVPTAWRDPAHTVLVNVVGTTNLLMILAEIHFTGRLLFVSTADVYGTVPEDQLPVSELREPAPRNPYASSKIGAEVMCRQWARTHGLDVLIARPFNHTGVGQRPDFALSSFAKDIAAISKGQRPPTLATGDLDVTRDYLDVDDVAHAYLALLAHGQAGETYNVCSGTEVSLRDALNSMLCMAGIEANLVVDSAKLRPSEQRRMCGDHGKLASSTPWRPSIPMQSTLRKLLNYWSEFPNL